MLHVLKAHLLSASRDGWVCRENASLVLSADGVIEGVYDTLPEAYQNVPVTDYGDAILTPAFCDLHLHAPQFPMLGLGMDLQLIDWLNDYAFKTEARFADPAYARRVYRKLARTLVMGGTTRVCMFSSLHTDATLILMEELARAGVTGYVGKVNMDRNGGENLQETTQESLRETRRWLDACGDGPVKPILTPRFTPSCTDELMAELGRLAEARSLRVQSHLSENRDELAWVRALHPDCPQYWETYQKFGLWKPYTAMAHCVHSDERERAAMREAGVYMIHCPDSNINVRSGTAPVRRALSEGLCVALGSDISGGARLAMADVITLAVRASKQRWMQTEGADDFLRLHEAFYLATDAGARYFGSNGGFTPGEKLHALVFSDAGADIPLPEAARALTLPERMARLLYAGGTQSIAAVYSEGREIKQALQV